MTDAAAQWLTLRSTGLSAQIDPLGAQLSTLRDGAGRDLLWNGDANVWAGRAPLLFPIVGTLAGGSYRLGEHRYALSRHGFARGKPFEVLEHTSDRARLVLRADAQTLAVYPFDFELQMQYAVADAGLAVTALIGNRGPQAMPASFGFHPAFRWPLPYGVDRDAHDIEFDAPEPEPIRRLTAAGLIDPVPQPTPVTDRRLVLDDGLFAADVVILDAVRSRAVSYGGPSGPRLRVAFPDSPFLGFWTKPGAGFICIEPWNGMSDPQGFDGSFADKPGVFTIAPQGQVQIRMQIEWLDDNNR